MGCSDTRHTITLLSVPAVITRSGSSPENWQVSKRPWWPLNWQRATPFWTSHTCPCTNAFSKFNKEKVSNSLQVTGAVDINGFTFSRTQHRAHIIFFYHLYLSCQNRYPPIPPRQLLDGQAKLFGQNPEQAFNRHPTAL